jgi:Ribosomal S17
MGLVSFCRGKRLIVPRTWWPLGGHREPVLSIYLTLGRRLVRQEEERERRMDFVPDESAVNTELIEVKPSCCRTVVLASSERLGGRAVGWWPYDGRLTAGFVCSTLVQVDQDTMDLLRSMNMSNLPGVQVIQVRGSRANSVCLREGGVGCFVRGGAVAVGGGVIY